MAATLRTICTLLLVVSPIQGHSHYTFSPEHAHHRATIRGEWTPTLGTQGVEVRQKFVGHWRLVKFESFDGTGDARDAGYESGRITYDAVGNMSAQLMRTGRKPLSQPSTESERAAAYSTYTAYYGRYIVDAGASSVTHAVEGALNPNWVNTDLVRYYEFSPDARVLKLSLRNLQGRVTATLTWQRM